MNEPLDLLLCLSAATPTGSPAQCVTCSRVLPLSNKFCEACYVLNGNRFANITLIISGTRCLMFRKPKEDPTKELAFKNGWKAINPHVEFVDTIQHLWDGACYLLDHPFSEPYLFIPLPAIQNAPRIMAANLRLNYPGSSSIIALSGRPLDTDMARTPKENGRDIPSRCFTSIDLKMIARMRALPRLVAMGFGKRDEYTTITRSAIQTADELLFARNRKND